MNYSLPNSKIDPVIKRILLEYGYEETPNFIIERLYSPILQNNYENFYKINLLLNSILIKYKEDENSFISFKNDGLIVLVFKSICIKIFSKQNIIPRFIDKLYDILLENNCPYLEQIYEIRDDDKLNVFIVVSKTIDTQKFKDRLEQDSSIIKEDIEHALIYLKSNKWTHYDARIDNVGFDQELNNYVLFDFDMSKYDEDSTLLNNNLINDINKLNISINFNLNLNNPMC
jgi:hypothetical protein